MSLHRSPRARLHLRRKLRPFRQTRFNIEIRTHDVSNIPLLEGFNGSRWITAKEREDFNELQTFIATIRSMIGRRAKIIQHRRRTILSTKVLLESESDLVVLTMAHPSMIARAYRYVDRPTPSPSDSSSEPEALPASP